MKFPKISLPFQLSEKDAFYLLKHLMFKRSMRLKYLPEMNEFQLELYQLSRLIKDFLPALHNHLDRNDISPTLYASPWILTIFSSTFPLGFVSRVFDLLFFATDEVVFRVILALLEVHAEEILNLEGFEDITSYMKEKIPQISSLVMEAVFNRVYTLNITRQLMDYKIEYSVLKEEISQNNRHLENLKKSQEEKKLVEKKLKESQNNVERLQSLKDNQDKDVKNLKSQIKTLETTLHTLGDFLADLIVERHDIDLPADVRRILSQMEYQRRQVQMSKHQIFIDRKILKSLSLSSSVGLNSIHENDNENENDCENASELPTITPLSPLPSQISRNKFFQNLSTEPRIKRQDSVESDDSSGSTGYHIQELKVLENYIRTDVLTNGENKDQKLPENCEKSNEQIPLICGDINFLIQPSELKSIRSCRKQWKLIANFHKL